MKVRRIEVGQMKANCYLVIDEKSEKCLIIDPGDDADYIERIIVDEAVEPDAIIATHGHFDHVMAVTELKLAYDIPFYMSEKDAFLLDRMNSSAQHFTGANSQLLQPVVDMNLKPGKLKIEKLLVGRQGWEIEVIETAGHTPGSVSLYFKKDSSVFVGDLVFDGGHVGRTDFKYSDNDELKKSMKKVLKLPGETIIYAGHGDATTVSQLSLIFPSKPFWKQATL